MANNKASAVIKRSLLKELKQDLSILESENRKDDMEVYMNFIKLRIDFKMNEFFENIFAIKFKYCENSLSWTQLMPGDDNIEKKMTLEAYEIMVKLNIFFQTNNNFLKLKPFREDLVWAFGLDNIFDPIECVTTMDSTQLVFANMVTLYEAISVNDSKVVNGFYRIENNNLIKSAYQYDPNNEIDSIIRYRISSEKYNYSQTKYKYYVEALEKYKTLPPLPEIIYTRV